MRLEPTADRGQLRLLGCDWFGVGSRHQVICMECLWAKPANLSKKGQVLPVLFHVRSDHAVQFCRRRPQPALAVQVHHAVFQHPFSYRSPAPAQDTPIPTQRGIL